MEKSRENLQVKSGPFDPLVHLSGKNRLKPVSEGFQTVRQSFPPFFFLFLFFFLFFSCGAMNDGQPDKIRLLVYVWGDGERIKFFKLIKRGKRGEKRGKITDLFTTISEGVSRCGRRECERTTMARERYQDDAEARRVISRFNPSGYSA
jgi:hypothetical protein